MKGPTIMAVVASLLTAATFSVVPVSVDASTDSGPAHTGLFEKDGIVKEQTSATESENAKVRQSFAQEENDDSEPAATVELHTPGGVDKETTSQDREQPFAYLVQIQDANSGGADDDDDGDDGDGDSGSAAG